MNDTLYLWLCRCESVGGDRKWSMAAGPQWSGQGVLSNQQTKVSATGRAGRTQCAHHDIRYMHWRFTCASTHVNTRLVFDCNDQKALGL